MNAVKVGVITGNGSTLVVQCGFQPDYIEVVDATDRNAISRFFRGMTAGAAIVSGPLTGVAAIETGGIELFAGDETRAPGFKILATVNVNAKKLRYVAMRGTDGAFNGSTDLA